MKKYFIIIGLCLILSSCATTQSNKQNLTPFPPSPNWKSWNQNPIKKVNDDGTVVVDENVVAFSIQCKKWKDRVEDWKYKNKIP